MPLRMIVLVSTILIAAIIRLLPHPPNFTPIMAMALFSGAHLMNKRLAFLIPLAAMLVSDLLLGFHATMPAVYFAFALAVVIGFWIQRAKSVSRIAAGTLLASISFFVITNAAVWAMTPLYTKDVAGLSACFIAAIPFFQHSLTGDLFYSTLFFGGFALLERTLPMLRSDRPSVI